MEDIVLLEWSYKPSNYFEEKEVFKYHNIEVVISDGKVIAQFEATQLKANPKLADELYNDLYAIFQGMQIFTHKKFDLSKSPAKTVIHPDGKKHNYLSINIMESGQFIENVDLEVMDKNGNIISNSRKERIEKQREFSSLVKTYRIINQNVAKMLNSYEGAVRHPDDELVYLYEIREALQKEFKEKKRALKTLNLSEKEWDRLGALTCVEPLKQGRHRGQIEQDLRDATSEELEEARAITRKMVEAYIRYLEP
jgi:hypothetical protein